MRPNRQNTNDVQYRRNRNDGRSNAVRIAAVLTVAIGIVAAALVLTNTFEFNPTSDSTAFSGSQNQTGFRSNGSGDSSNSTVISDAVNSVAGNTKTGDSTTSNSTTGDSSMSGSTTSNSTTGSTSSSSGAAGTSSNGQAGISTGESNTESAIIPEDTKLAADSILTGCSIHGRVTDSWGAAVANVRVFATTSEGTVIETATDSRGRYTIPGDNSDVVNVSIALTHVTDFGESFTVMNGDDVISLNLGVDPATTGCEVNFDSWNVHDDMVASPISTDLWPDAASIYQYTLNAESLALSLGVELNDSPTLQVQAWCDDPNLGCDAANDGAYFIAENELGDDTPPIIAMLPARSSSQSAGVPDNREYHEYGHYFLSMQAGDNFELPPGDKNHGGYYENSSTRDSFVEGFAEFYSMMVSRHIDGDDNAEMYTIGADYDLETDRLPWEAAGWWEEFTIAGLLLDLVDDDADYAGRGSGLTGVNMLGITVDNESSGTIVSGSIFNASPLVVRNADITVHYMNDAGEVVGTQVTRALPEVIAPTREGTFYAAPPAGLDVSQATAVLGGIAKSDDDDMSIGLLRLMSIITEYERPDSNGARGVSTVSELHDALINGEFSGSDGDSGLSEITAEAVDELFINHGFFADLDGDKQYDPAVDGKVGASSHPVTQLGETSYSAFIPRQDPDAYDDAFVKINTGDAAVDAIIQISMPGDGGSGSYAYVAPRDGSNSVELAVPPADQDASVTIITAGKDYKPVIAFRVDADEFHAKVDNGTVSELQIKAVELEPGSALNAPAVKGSTIQLGIMVGGIAAVLLVVASLIAIRRQWSKA